MRSCHAFYGNPNENYGLSSNNCMASSLLACPICSQPGFSSVDALRHRLISAATRQLVCPVCQDVLLGLDKFTIHLFSHSVQHSYAKPSELRDATASALTIPSRAENSHDSRFIQDKHDGCKVVNRNLIQDNQSLVHGHITNSETLIKVEKTWNKKVQGYRNSKAGLSFEQKVNEELTKDNNGGESDSPLNLSSTSVSTPEVIACELCQFAFPDPAVLEIHHQLVHNNGDYSASKAHDKNVFPCNVCNRAFKMRGSLMVHMRVAHGGITAGKTLQNPPESVDQLETRNFPCTTCGKSFKKEQHLSQHIKTHEGKQWECDVCSKMFTTKYFLKKHKRLHTGEMPYSCATCNKTFTFQQSYHKHLLYHSDDKPHVCTECDRAFKELSTLHNHQRIHTGEKPFACETCDVLSANPA